MDRSSEERSRASTHDFVTLTDANYGNEVFVLTAHITACTIVSETTYREGKIPEEAFRRTLVYTIGGNQLAVRETPEEIMQKMFGVK